LIFLLNKISSYGGRISFLITLQGDFPDVKRCRHIPLGQLKADEILLRKLKILNYALAEFEDVCNRMISNNKPRHKKPLVNVFDMGKLTYAEKENLRIF
jgi:hypothetical protein